MKTILVLGDEVTLQHPLWRVLQLHGYRTLEAGDGEEALTQFHANNRRIDLLVADVSLPIGSGVRVAVTLRELLPALVVILISGYPFHVWRARDYALLGRLGPDSVSILQKPFAAQTLSATIRSLLGGEKTEAAGIA